MANALARMAIMVPMLGILLAGCTADGVILTTPAAEITQIPPAPTTHDMDQLIAYYARRNDVPEKLVRRIIVRESGYNPSARNGPYWGLMQIAYPTARTMGYRGAPAGLLDAGTNLRYAVKYLGGAYLVAGGNSKRALYYYAHGYYYLARDAGLLDETGLGHDRHRS